MLDLKMNSNVVVIDQESWQGRQDYLVFSEFRIFLLTLTQYLKFYQAFNRLSTTYKCLLIMLSFFYSIFDKKNSRNGNVCSIIAYFIRQHFKKFSTKYLLMPNFPASL
jgi:hypothetical protein